MNGRLPTMILLDAYREGVFPMAESAEDEAFAFYRPHMRGLLPIADLHIPQKLLKIIRQNTFHVTIDRAFEDVIDGCAAAAPKRDKTWINRPIRNLFVGLHNEGHAHSVECWNADGTLAGGLYGLSIGAVFCGESMFSNTTNASKVALAYLCAILWRCGFTILDTQFINAHLLQFGAYEIPQEKYEEMIPVEMKKNILFRGNPQDCMNDYLSFRADSISAG